MAAEAEGSEGERGRKARERRTEEQAKHRQRSGRTEAHNFKAHLDILARLGPETPTMQMQQDEAMQRCPLDFLSKVDNESAGIFL